MAKFNLIDEPWIPCIDLQGKQVEHGIKSAMLKAHELSEIVDDSPLVTVAIHRLLLAILYRAFQGPTSMREWQVLYKRSAFEADGPIDSYLEKWRERFFLFHDTHPFMQVAELDLNEYKNDGSVRKDKTSGMMRLAKEAPDQSGRILFDHRMGNVRPEYEPKQIVKMLLSSQNYSGTGTGNSTGKIGAKNFSNVKASAGPCVDGLVLWLQGNSLFETLLLNLVPREFFPSDLPCWEDDHIVQSAINSWTRATSFTGPCQRFAPLSRFIRAIDLRSIFFTNGLKVAADANDPMKAYFRENDSKPYTAAKLREHKAAWRDAHTLMAVGQDNHKCPECLNFAARLANSGASMRLRANVVGMATDQDKALLWRHERMPVPTALLNDVNLIERLGSSLVNAEQAGGELNSRIRRIAKLYLSPTAEDQGGREPHKDDVSKMAQDLDPRPAYWARLERHFLDLLENLPNDWDADAGEWKPEDQQNATNAWRENVKLEAKRALEESIQKLGTTARAIQAVARVRTDFNDDDLKPKAQKNRTAKGKGGQRKE